MILMYLMSMGWDLMYNRDCTLNKHRLYINIHKYR